MNKKKARNKLVKTKQVELDNKEVVVLNPNEYESIFNGSKTFWNVGDEFPSSIYFRIYEVTSSNIFLVMMVNNSNGDKLPSLYLDRGDLLEQLSKETNNIMSSSTGVASSTSSTTGIHRSIQFASEAKDRRSRPRQISKRQSVLKKERGNHIAQIVFRLLSISNKLGANATEYIRVEVKDKGIALSTDENSTKIFQLPADEMKKVHVHKVLHHEQFI